MSREKTLVKNTLIITIGKICTQLITFLLLPLYTNILTTEEYGVVDLLNTLVSLLLPIITFQIERAVFRELIESRQNKNEEKRIISSSIICVTIQCLIYLAIFAGLSIFLHNNYKEYLAANVITYIYASLFLQLARGLGDNKKYAVASFLSALSTVLLNILFLVIIRLGVYGMLLSNILGQVVCAIYLFFSLKIYKYLFISSFSGSMIKKLWKYSIPLIPNAISWWIFNASDRIIVSAILGLSSTGILSAANKFSTVYVTFYNIFDMSWTESISLHIHERDIARYFNKIFNIMLSLFTSLAIGIIACMPFVYPILINHKFQSGYNLVPILIIASLFNVLIGLVDVVYVANRNTKAVANSSMIAALINIVSHLSLIKYVGLYAAAISTLLSFLIMSFNRLFDISENYFSIKIKRSLAKKTLIVLPIVLITYYINNLYLNILSLILAIIFAWDINKKSINILLNFIKKKIN